MTVAVAVLLVACKREEAPRTQPPPPAPARDARATAAIDAASSTWYRATVRAPDGVEAVFLLGVPSAGGTGRAVFRSGDHDVTSDATFDGAKLRVPLDVHQTAVDAVVADDRSLRGEFTASWRAWGAAQLPLTATPIDAPKTHHLATVAGDGANTDLGEARTIWRVAMNESGTAKLVIEQLAAGVFHAQVFFDTGNIVYLAGTGRGTAIALTGFDGTAGYRLELDVDGTRARGRWFAGHRFDWRETLTATRTDDFALAAKARPARSNAKVTLPDVPQLANLEAAPMIVELAGSWCSTCRNAAPFLVELYRQYEPRGLRMVTLLYEFTDDPAVDAKQAERFKQDYAVPWPVVAVPGTVDDLGAILPSGLRDINPAGFPIALFLSADRRLVALHAGFPASSAAEEHRRVRAEFHANVEKILGAK